VATNPTPVRVATRASELARWQADHVAGLLRGAHPGLEIEIVPVSTEGDRRTDVPLSVIGGKGVFSKEIQRAVLDGRADIAVHSAKDLPALTPDGLTLAALPTRGDPRDALVGADLASLRSAVDEGRGAVVATGSARRRVQLAALVPGVGFEELRGNMATRLQRSGEFDAIVVAVAALERLELTAHLSEVLAPDAMVPQVGQGALAIECRSDERWIRDLLGAIDDAATNATVSAERAFLVELGGDCSLPAGAHCTIVGPDELRIEGVLAAEPDPGSPVLRGSLSTSMGPQEPSLEAQGSPADRSPEELGRALAVSLRARMQGG